MPEEKTFAPPKDSTPPKGSPPPAPSAKGPAGTDDSLIKKYGHHAVTVAIGGCIAALATFYTETRATLIELQSDRITNEARLMTLEEKLQAQDQILLEKLQTIDGKVDALAQIIDEVHPRQ